MQHPAVFLVDLPLSVETVLGASASGAAWIDFMRLGSDARKSNPHLSHAEALRTSMLQVISNSSKPE
jgi:hypothetical protein